MALSDYLTGDEWDACFYASLGKNYAENFGESMRKTISDLLKTGYNFSGLDENGNKVMQVEDGVNASKILIFLGNPNRCNVAIIMNNGRNFLKKHCPDLVNETDDEWDKMLKPK